LEALANPDRAAPPLSHWDLASLVKCYYAITFPNAAKEIAALPPRQPATVLNWWQTELGGLPLPSTSSSISSSSISAPLVSSMTSVWSLAAYAAEVATEWRQYEHVMNLLLSVVRSRPTSTSIAPTQPLST
jgi:hypothetical protein